MKAILVSAPMKFDLVECPHPKCGPGQVLIRTAFCGICGTDLEILRGSISPRFTRYPLVPGHEWTGVVVEVGREVEDCAVGDRVAVEGYLNCGACYHCKAGETNLCESHEQIGFTHNGGFGEYVVAPAKSCHRIPEHISLDEALLVEPASTVVRGIQRASPKPGFTAAVIGCGPIGQIAIRVLNLYEPSAVLAMDLSELQHSLATRAGATAFVSSLDISDLLRKGGTEARDVVVDCAGGSKAIETALRIVKRGGNVVAIGGAPEQDRVSFPANLFVTKDLRIDGVFGYTTQSWIHTLDLLTSGKLRLADLITHRLPLDEFSRAINLLQSRTEPLGKVIVTYE
jgi:2-desacetyl-2-hydroxyethyl bacteriochlorophyllide A dehydrogenase